VKRGAATVPVETFLEVVCAVHLASYVRGAFPERGGLMVAGPPGVLKSALLDVLDKTYPDALKLSDVNMPTLIALRDQLSTDTIRTLLIPDLAKLYERDPRTASNLEGTLRALVAEGYTAAAFEDSRVSRFTARACVVAALTPKLWSDKFAAWEDSGFSRRFLWALVRLKDPRVLDRAVERWRPLALRLGRHVALPALDRGIPNLVSPRSRRTLKALLKYQPGGMHATQFALLAKVLAVLTWHYRQTRRRGQPAERALDTLRVFAPCLGKEGAQLVVRE